MTWPQTINALAKYRDYVIKFSRSNLSRAGMGSHTRLYKTLRGVIGNKYNRDARGRFTGGSVPSLSFFMESYGAFVDQGVKGTKDEDMNRMAKPYKFDKKKKMINIGAVESFIAKRSIRARGKDGKFTKKSSLKFAIAKSIHQKGIKRSLFFTKPMNKGLKIAASRVADGAANDITNQLVKDLKIYFHESESKH